MSDNEHAVRNKLAFYRVQTRSTTYRWDSARAALSRYVLGGWVRNLLARRSGVGSSYDAGARALLLAGLGVSPVKSITSTVSLDEPVVADRRDFFDDALGVTFCSVAFRFLDDAGVLATALERVARASVGVEAFACCWREGVVRVTPILNPEAILGHELDKGRKEA